MLSWHLRTITNSPIGVVSHRFCHSSNVVIYLTYFKAPLPQRQPKDSRRNRAAQAQVLGIYLSDNKTNINSKHCCPETGKYHKFLYIYFVYMCNSPHNVGQKFKNLVNKRW